MQSSLFFIVLLGGMIALMFFTSRQNKKRQQKAREFVDSIKKGQVVITRTGYVGVIEEVDTKSGLFLIKSGNSTSYWVKEAINDAPVNDDIKAVISGEKQAASIESSDNSENAEKIVELEEI